MKRAHAAIALAALLSACRGQPSDQPPIHIVPDMDWQPKYQPEGESKFFLDGRAMRPVVPGTVPAAMSPDDDAHFGDTAWNEGKTAGAYVGKAPINVDDAVLRRGEERFGIYCTPCHDKSASGHGTVVQRGYPLPTNLASDHTRALPDGEIFDIISHGVRNMPAYGPQIPVDDRWKIIAWVRVIQRSQHAAIGDVPADERGRIQPEGATP